MSNPQPFSRAQRTLYLAMICVGMGQSVVFAVMPMLGRELQLDLMVLTLPGLDWQWQPKELAITSLSALTALTFSLISPFWGRLSDRIGRKPVILLGLLGYTAGMLLFSVMAWLGLQAMISGLLLYLLLMLTRFLHSLMMSASFPAANAFMVDSSHQTVRARALGRLAACMQLGIMFGPALAWLAGWHLLLPFICQALLMLLVGLFVLWRFPAHPPVAMTGQRKKLGYFAGPYRVYLGLALLFYTGLGMVQQTLGFYFQDVLQLQRNEAAQAYAFAMMFSSAAMLAAQFGIVQRFSLSPQRLIRAGLPFAFGGFFMLAAASQLWMLQLGMMAFGFAMGLVGPSIAAAASLTVDGRDQGALAGLVGSVAGMGFVVGPLVGGMVYSQMASLPYLLSASAALLAWLYLLLAGLPGEIIREST